MRSSENRAGRPGLRAIGAALAIAVVTAAGWLMAAPLILAASPSPSAAPAGDPRSSGQGPGLVGDPMLALGIVVAIGLASLVATLLYVRATRGPGAA